MAHSFGVLNFADDATALFFGPPCSVPSVLREPEWQPRSRRGPGQNERAVKSAQRLAVWEAGRRRAPFGFDGARRTGK